MDKGPQGSLKLVDPSDPLQGRDGTIFDKEAPTGPPNAPVRAIPPHLGKVIKFFEGIIADEGLLLDLCLDRAVGIVEYNYKKRAFGVDLMQENLTPAAFISLSAPLAVELYKEVLAAVGQRAGEYKKLLDEAHEEMKSGGKSTSPIYRP